MEAVAPYAGDGCLPRPFLHCTILLCPVAKLYHLAGKCQASRGRRQAAASNGPPHSAEKISRFPVWDRNKNLPDTQCLSRLRRPRLWQSENHNFLFPFWDALDWILKSRPCLIRDRPVSRTFSSMKICLPIGTLLLDGKCQEVQGGAIRCPSRREFTAPPCARFPSFRARSKGWACTA